MDRGSRRSHQSPGKAPVEDAAGNGALGDIASGARIGEAYAKAGKELGAFILKETK